MISKVFSFLCLRRRRPRTPLPARYLLAAIILSCRGEGVGLTEALAAAGTTAGLTDPAASHSEAVLILCDPTAASSCDEPHAIGAIEGVARYAAERPGSEVQLFVLGGTVAETTEVASIVVPERTEASPRVLHAEARRFVETARRSLCPPLRPHFLGPRPRRSPIAESLARLAMVNTHGLPRRILYLGDLREVGVADFECRPIPTAVQWAALLRRRNLFAAGSFAGTRVHFARVEGAPVRGRGCTVSVARELAIRERFREALTHAGAVRVTFDTGLPEIGRLFAEEPTHTNASTTSTTRRPR